MAERGRTVKPVTAARGRGRKAGAAHEVEQAGRRALLRLLRLVLSGPVQVMDETPEGVVLGAADGTRTTHAASIVAGACARGLLHRRDNRMEAGSEARAFLRRALADAIRRSASRSSIAKKPANRCRLTAFCSPCAAI